MWSMLCLLLSLSLSHIHRSWWKYFFFFEIIPLSLIYRGFIERPETNATGDTAFCWNIPKIGRKSLSFAFMHRFNNFTENFCAYQQNMDVIFVSRSKSKPTVNHRDFIAVICRRARLILIRCRRRWWQWWWCSICISPYNYSHSV